MLINLLDRSMLKEEPFLSPLLTLLTLHLWQPIDLVDGHQMKMYIIR
jgi:hypothetical protein